MNIQQPQNLYDVNQVAQCINVNPPYFAFKELWAIDQLLMGSFVAEQPLAYEVGPITAGELGRHLAILGSCAAATLQSGEEKYYLATKAHFIRKATCVVSANDLLYASAQVLSMNQRNLTVRANAWGREPLAELICEYIILSPAVFKRSFKQYYINQDLTRAAHSPYAQSISLHYTVVHEGRLEATGGPLSPEQCAGHFDNYPCWPVAIISQTAFSATGELLKRRLGKNVRFCVRETTLFADKLVCASTVLRFNVELTGRNDTMLESVARIYRGSEEVARLISTLEIREDEKAQL